MTAATLGVVLSVPLIWTTNYEIRKDQLIYAKKNIGFIFAFLGVFAIRFRLRNELTMLDAQTKAAQFMMVAICYIVPWRIVAA